MKQEKLAKSKETALKPGQYIYLNTKSRVNLQVYSLQITPRRSCVLTPVYTQEANNRTRVKLQMPERTFLKAVADGYYKPLKTKQ